MSSRAKRNPFGAVLHGAKGSLLILQRQVQLGLREPKTETMLAWGASFLLTRHVPSLPCYCRQTVSKPCLSAPWAETKGGLPRLLRNTRRLTKTVRRCPPVIEGIFMGFIRGEGRLNLKWLGGTKKPRKETYSMAL